MPTPDPDTRDGLMPRMLAEQADDILALLDAAGRVLYVNRAVRTLLGHPRRDLIGSAVCDLVHAADLARARAAFERAMARPGRPVTLRCRVRHRQGGWRWLEVRGAWRADLAGQAAATLVARDVTCSLRRERLLTAWMAGMSQVTPQAGDFLRGLCAALADSHDLLLAYAMRQAPGEPARVLAHAGKGCDLLKDILAEDRPEGPHFPGLRGAESSGDAPRILTRVQLAHLPWHLVSAAHRLEQVALVPLRGAAAEHGWLVLCATHRQAFAGREDRALLREFGRHAGIALDGLAAQRRLELLGGALAAVADAVFITDRRGVIEWVNDAFTRLTGIDAAAAVGATPRILRSGLHEQAYYDELLCTIRAGRPWHGETTNRRRDGSLYTVEQTITPVLAGRRQVRHFVAIQQDITERKRLEREARDLALAIARARAEERCVIAREIHDELGGSLAALKHDLEWLLGRDQDAASRQRLEVMHELLLQSLDMARRLAANLHPSLVDQLGTAGALQWLARDFGQRTGLRVFLDLPAGIDRLRGHLASEVYRVVQECLTNVDKHARANEVRIRAHIQDGRLELEVSDDGVGYSSAAADAGVALGIRGMAERAQCLGGYLEIARIPDDGTRVRMVVPLDAAQPKA